MGGHVENAMRLEVEVMAPVGDDVIFVLVAAHGNAVERLLEQVDGGRGIEREHARPGRRPRGAR